MTQKIAQVAIQVAAVDVDINQLIDQIAIQAADNNATAQTEVKQIIQQILPSPTQAANLDGDSVQTIDLIDKIVLIALVKIAYRCLKT